MTDIKLCKAAGEKNTVELRIEIHKVTAYILGLIIVGITIEVVELQKHKRFSEKIIRSDVTVQYFTKRSIIRQRLREMLWKNAVF